MKKIIIAIDGVSSCGKSTTAKAVAHNLGYAYIDSGAMYRAVTLYFQQHYISLSNTKEILRALNDIEIKFHYNEKTGRSDTYLNGLNVEDEIRDMHISKIVSEVSAVAEVRRAMVTQQQKMGKRSGVVMDGRDIGTNVFPAAELKIFMTADINIRAQRRQKELLERGDSLDMNEVIQNLEHRDHIDSHREENPLLRAEDAVDLDTTFMTIDEQVEFVMNLASARIVRTERPIMSFL